MSWREEVVKTIILGSLFIGIICPRTSLADAAKIFKENTEAVVVIIAYDSEGKAITQGSGFAVRQDGAVVTSYHVINKATDLKVKAINNGPPFDEHSKVLGVQGSGLIESLKVEGLIYIDKENDIAILKVGFNRFSELYPSYPTLLPPLGGPAPLKSLPSVKLGDINKVNVGEKIYVIGSPEGFENTISEGILSGLRDFTMREKTLLPPIDFPQIMVDDSSEARMSKRLRYDRKIEYRRKILQFTAPISPGSSGGPVFNENGEVIGVVTFLMKEAQNINFAMPVNLIKDEIKNKEVIPLAHFQEEFEREYIRGLAGTLAKTARWTERLPENKTMEVCEEVLKLNPNHGQARFMLIIVYINRGDKKKALEHYRILKKVDPDRSKGLEAMFGPGLKDLSR
jgi:S1-C subfamily serine protease